MKTITLTTTGLVAILACMPRRPRTIRSIPGGLAERFDRVDRDGDGKITAKELPQPEIFRRLDRNGDGVVERSEIPGARRPATDGNEQAKVIEKLDLAYGEHASQRLDLYQPAAERGSYHGLHPWRRMEARGQSCGRRKGSLFQRRGWMFVSVNYRLLPEGKHPANVNDVAQAMAWIHENVTNTAEIRTSCS